MLTISAGLLAVTLWLMPLILPLILPLTLSFALMLMLPLTVPLVRLLNSTVVVIFHPS